MGRRERNEGRQVFLSEDGRAKKSGPTKTAVNAALLGALALVVLHGLAVAAYAGGYSAWVGGGANGTSPHGGYSDSTTKCKVCHAVHNASTGAGQQSLLRSAKGGDACIYCHLNPGTVSAKRPYGQGGGSVSNYVRTILDTDIDWNHASWHSDSAPYTGCPSCHATHGANTIPGEKDLNNNPGKAIAGAVTTKMEFCRDCHNKTGGNLLAGGCFAGCHGGTPYQPNSISSEYFTEVRDEITHVMTTTLTGTGSGGLQVAWKTSETCQQCHAAGQPFANGDSYPHYTPNAVQFLDYGYTTQDTDLDRVCMNCHTDSGSGTAYTSGVGKTF